MNKIEEIIDYYLEWQDIVENPEYKNKTLNEKDSIRLKYDEDAKYYKSLGLDDNTALRADVIVSFWTIYKSLLFNEAKWSVSKTSKSLKALKRQLNSTGEYSKKILEVNDMLYDFATICYSKGNYMLLPVGARAMNNQRYLFTEDRIDATLYQCFGKGMLSKYFESDSDFIKWVKDQNLEVCFKDREIKEGNIVWMTKALKPKLISEMGTDEIMEYVQSAISLIKNRTE